MIIHCHSLSFTSWDGELNQEYPRNCQFFIFEIFVSSTNLCDSLWMPYCFSFVRKGQIQGLQFGLFTLMDLTPQATETMGILPVEDYLFHLYNRKLTTTGLIRALMPTVFVGKRNSIDFACLGCLGVYGSPSYIVLKLVLKVTFYHNKASSFRVRDLAKLEIS